MAILIAGSSGLLGSALIRSLQGDGIEVRRLIRPGRPGEGIPWDPAAGVLPADALDGIDAVVNFAGRSIGDRRWSAAEKTLLRDSRVLTTRLLAEAVASRARPPALLNASAVGYYGNRGEEAVDESSPPGAGFLADLCVEWEAATAPAVAAGARVVLLRTGIVLDPAGGALGRLLAPFGPAWLSPYRWGLGGVVGRGRQHWSWISRSDQVRAVRHLLGSALAGPVNLVAPQSASHRDFIRALGRALRRPTALPIPPFVIKAILGGELAQALVLDGQRVVPGRLTSDGFRWDDEDLETALRAALDR